LTGWSRVSVYGNNLDLRTWLEDQGYWYVLAVAHMEQIGIMTPNGPRLMTVKEAERLNVQTQDWQRLSVRTGTKGPLFFDWACLPILHRWVDDGKHWVLIRRIPSQPTEKTYYLVFGPVGTTLETMAWAIGHRWCIEEEFENAKDLGLDHYEVRNFVGWMRHITLVLLALAVLTVICARERVSATATSGAQAHQMCCSPIPLTVPEVRHLLARLLFPLPCNVIRALTWSWWRRCQQARARASHTKHRLNSS
jgi:SRSO17 transposase